MPGSGHLQRTEQIVQDASAAYRRRTPREFNGKAGHVHLLASFPPTAANSRLVNALNGMSSRYPRQEFRACAGGILRRVGRRRPFTLSCASTSDNNALSDLPTSGRLDHPV
jgi:REP element-mobilizing transposase RayT